MTITQIVGSAVIGLLLIISIIAGKDFWSKLLNPNDGTVSSKTFGGVLSLVIALVLALSNTYFGMPVQEFIFLGLLGFSAACFGLNTFITGKQVDVNKSPEVNVANAKTVNVSKDKEIQLTDEAREFLDQTKAYANQPLAENEIIG